MANGTATPDMFDPLHGAVEKIGGPRNPRDPNPVGHYYDRESGSVLRATHYAQADALVRMGWQLVDKQEAMKHEARARVKLQQQQAAEAAAEAETEAQEQRAQDIAEAEARAEAGDNDVENETSTQEGEDVYKATKLANGTMRYSKNDTKISKAEYDVAVAAS